MNKEEKALWLSDFYRKVVIGGVIQLRKSLNGAGGAMGQHWEWYKAEGGPSINSDPVDWRIEPEPKKTAAEERLNQIEQRITALENKL